MGCLFTGRFKKVNAVIIKEHLRIWFIKAFFTPIVLGVMVKNADYLLSFNWHGNIFLNRNTIFCHISPPLEPVIACIGTYRGVSCD